MLEEFQESCYRTVHEKSIFRHMMSVFKLRLMQERKKLFIFVIVNILFNLERITEITRSVL